jgi:hypothetical protein
MVVDAPDLAGIIVAALALAHVEDGHLDDARRLLEQAAAADFEYPLDGNWLSTLAYYAEAAIACRDSKCSRTLFDRLGPWADQAPYPGLIIDSPVSHYLGGLATVLGRYDEADTYFAHAAAFNDRASAKFFAARTNLSWATTGILVSAGAPALTNVSIARSSLSGIQVQTTGAPTIQSCSVDTSGNYGLNVSGSTGTITLTNTSFTNNAWYPVIVDDTTLLSGLTGLTATGNGSFSSARRPSPRVRPRRASRSHPRASFSSG